MCVSTGNAGSPNACVIDDARGLVADAGESLQRLHVVRHLPAVLLDERLRERFRCCAPCPARGRSCG